MGSRTSDTHQWREETGQENILLIAKEMPDDFEIIGVMTDTPARTTESTRAEYEMTILLAVQMLQFVRAVPDRFVILDRGRCMVNGPIDRLDDNLSGNT